MVQLKMSHEGAKLSAGDLQKLEKELRVRLPASYKKFLFKHNGGRPDRSYFQIRPSQRKTVRNFNWIDCFCHVSFASRSKSFGVYIDPVTKNETFVYEDSSYDRDVETVWWNTAKFEAMLPKGAIVIASCADSALILMHTIGELRGAVILFDAAEWPKKKSSRVLAASLDDFVGRLRSTVEEVCP